MIRRTGSRSSTRGTPMEGPAFTAEFAAGGYRARGYVGGIFYAPLARPNEIKHMAW